MNSLVMRLEELSLVIVQIDWYMREMKTSCQKYLRLYNTSWSELQADVSRLRDYSNKSVQMTWSIFYKHVKQLNSTATKLLQLWMYLDHQDVWFDLLKRDSWDFKVLIWFQNIMQSEISFKRVIKMLLTYSLVESYLNIESYLIHSMIQN